jgi:hypothetical protein
VAPLVRALRLVAGTIRRPRYAAALSWLLWVLAVGAFALWSLYHHPVAEARPWIGMTIRTGVFAAWLLVAREWVSLRLQIRHGRSSERPGDIHNRGQ